MFRDEVGAGYCGMTDIHSGAEETVAEWLLERSLCKGYVPFPEGQKQLCGGGKVL